MRPSTRSSSLARRRRSPSRSSSSFKEGGRLVVPLGQRYQQTLYLFKKVKGVLQAEPLQPTFFVPMMGRAEEERAVPAEPGKPVLVNGDFQDAPDGQPAGWYYVRQGEGRERQSDERRQVPHFSQRHAGPRRTGFASGWRRRPANPRDRNLRVGPRSACETGRTARTKRGPARGLLQQPIANRFPSKGSGRGRAASIGSKSTCA